MGLYVLITFDLHVSEDKQEELRKTVYDYFRNSSKHLKRQDLSCLNNCRTGKEGGLTTETTIVGEISSNIASAQLEVDKNIKSLFNSVKEDTKIDFTYNFVFAISEIKPTVA